MRALEQPDGVELYTREYLVHSGTQARGVVLLVHGFTWHSGYFQPFAEFLTKSGTPPLPVFATLYQYFTKLFCKVPCLYSCRDLCPVLSVGGKSAKLLSCIQLARVICDRWRFLAAGFVVVTFDLRGHGRSGLVDGIPGYTPKFSDFTNDTVAVLQLAQERHPGMPSFILSLIHI